MNETIDQTDQHHAPHRRQASAFSAETTQEPIDFAADDHCSLVTCSAFRDVITYGSVQGILLCA